MAKNSFDTGDRVRAFDSWSSRSHGKGTVATVSDTGCGVVLDNSETERPAHYYNSELTKVNEKR